MEYYAANKNSKAVLYVQICNKLQDTFKGKKLHKVTYKMLYSM